MKPKTISSKRLFRMYFYPLVIWFYDHIGERTVEYTDLGYGNHNEERGWYVFNRFVSAEKYL